MRARIFIFTLALAAPSLQAQEDAAATAAASTSAAQPAAVAEPPLARSQTERNEMAARAIALKKEANAMQLAAQEQHKAAETGCWKKFLVSSCLEDARIVLRNEERRARQLEREARLLDRNVKRWDTTARVSEREAANAKKDAEIAEKAANAKK